MLTSHLMELLETSWVLLAGLLMPLPQAAEASGPLETKAVAVGSSVLLPGPGHSTDIYSIKWDYLNGTSSCTILQYYRGSLNPTIHMSYKGRVSFHPDNGSLLLEDVQESDSGIYKVIAGDGESLKILLEVLKPVSRPRLRSSALVAQGIGRVLCDVGHSRVDTITWKKDGQPLPSDRVLHLSSSLSVLYLRPVKKSDCGSYSCNASNGISWEETSLNITIAGVSPPFQNMLRVAVVAVVLAVVSMWGLIFPVCQSEKLRIRGELWRWLSAYTCGLVCIATALAGTAGVLWMQEEGPSIAIILPEMALSYVMVVTCLAAVTITFHPTVFAQLKNKTAQSTMSYAAPAGVGSVVLMTALLIKNIYHRHEEGCTEFMDVTTLVVSTAAVSALPLLAIFFCYHTTQGWKKDLDSGRTEKARHFEMEPSSKDFMSL